MTSRNENVSAVHKRVIYRKQSYSRKLQLE